MAGLTVATVCLALRWFSAPTAEDAALGVHELCAECGLSVSEIDELIAIMRDTNAPRAELLRGFYDTFEEGADAEPCEPCAQAVLDAAGH